MSSFRRQAIICFNPDMFAIRFLEIDFTENVLANETDLKMSYVKWW